jgi:hypothetical protein
MQSNLVRAALGCAILAFSASAATATNKPIPGIDVIVKKNPGGNAITATTDENGQITLRNLAPGDYEIDIDGPTLKATVDKISGRPLIGNGAQVLSIGIGGGFFGGSSHSSSSHQGAGPAQGTSHPSGTPTNSGDSGVSVNLNQMVATDNDSKSGNAPMITFTATVTPSSPGNAAPTGVVTFLSETPYCRDNSSQGMRIGFTVPEGPPALFKSNLRITWYTPGD